MTSADRGLLSAGRAGSPAEAATGDAAVLRAMLDAEAALARAWASVLPAVPAEAARAVTEAARAGRFDLDALVLRAREGGNPVIPLVADLRSAAGSQGAPYVHLGATSQDIMDTALMLVAHRALEHVLADLSRTAAALATLAAEHRATPMPGRTLTQHAVPTTFGLKAAGWRALALDAADRLRAVRAGLPAQLGGAAGTMAAFHAHALALSPSASPAASASASPAASVSAPPAGDIGMALAAAFAEEVGLAEPALPWHVLRTPVADLGGALAFTAGALGKLAADVLVLSRTEIGEVSEGAGGGSSAMPHKYNPVRATWIAAAARQAPPLAAVLYGSLAAEDERPAGAWHAEWQPLRELLRVVGGAVRDAAELAEGLRVHPERMRADLEATGGRILSERVAAMAGREPAEGQDPRQVADPDLLDPATYLGSAPELVDRALRRTARRTAMPPAPETS